MSESKQTGKPAAEPQVDVKPGAGETFKPQFERVMRVFNEMLDSYERENPDWLNTWTLRLIYGAVYSLKTYLEDPKDTGISWEFPAAELRYPFEFDWETLDKGGWESLRAKRGDLTLFRVTTEDLKDADRLAGKLAEGFIQTGTRFVFEVLAGGNPTVDPLEVAVVMDGEKTGLLLSDGLYRKLGKLPERRRQRAMSKLAERGAEFNYRFDLSINPDGAKTYRARGTLLVKFNPFVIDRGERRAYYRTFVGLFLKGLPAQLTPDKWSKETKRALSEELLGKFLKGLQEQIPEEKFPELPPEAILKPQVKAASRKTALVKVGLHAERQKFGEIPRPNLPSLFAEPEIKAAAEERGIEVVGMDITAAENKAWFACLTLLAETDYQGNLPSRELAGQSNSFLYSGSVPVLRFETAEYLRRYGVGGRETGRRGFEFNANERAEALKALRALNDKRFLFYYRRRYWTKDGREQFQVIKTVRPLLTITEGYEALTRAESEAVISGETSPETEQKLTTIAIEPAPIVVDQIKSYFVLKPANCYQEVKLVAPHASKYVYRLIDYLIVEAELLRRRKEPLVIEISLKALAYKLRMNAWIDSRSWRQIRGSLSKCYEIAKRLGYLQSYETVQGKTRELERLVLNPEKFRHSKTPALPEQSPQP